MRSTPRHRSIWAIVPGLGLLALMACGNPAADRRPVIFLMLDTLRADHLGFFGYGRDTSPNLDAFARENTAFAHAFTAAPWTPPSVATMLTGLYPSAHGFMPPDSHQEARESFERLSPELDTLPEILRKHGYRTAAVSPNPWISSRFGFDQGFETFEFRHAVKAEEIVAAGIHLLERFSEKGEPLFLYLHFLDPHNPYSAPAPYHDMFPATLEGAAHPYDEAMQRAIGLYDGEIRYLDRELGRFFSFLKERGMYDWAVIIVVADHGEQFREHGRQYHGNALYNEEVHVPLFLRDPVSERRSEVVEHVVSTVDLFPTVLGRVGIRPPPNQKDGLSLLDRKALARRDGVASELRRVTDQRAFISRDLQKVLFAVPLLTRDRKGKRARLWQNPEVVGLFDFQTDYLERRPLDDPTLRTRLQSLAQPLFARAAVARRAGATAPAAEMSEEALEQLRSLGYLE